MAIDSKSTLTVAAAFAAAMLAAPASHANTAVATEPINIDSSSETAPVPSPAALQRLEETAQLAWWWWPMMPPKFIDLWPEVTHVETIRTA
jgi:hypothetical protein